MEKDYWVGRWQEGRIGFNTGQVDARLESYFSKLVPQKNARVFLPLCGKTKDIGWLLQKNQQVVGVEWVALAVAELFDELKAKPKVEKIGRLSKYSATGIDIFLGDFFHLEASVLGKVDAVFDRAALVALPFEMRSNYAQHLIAVTKCAPQLLVTLAYDQNLKQGPPFSVPQQEVSSYYESGYDIEQLEQKILPQYESSTCYIELIAWHLLPKIKVS